jgi:hypothetical protein
MLAATFSMARGGPFARVIGIVFGLVGRPVFDRAGFIAVTNLRVSSRTSGDVLLALWLTTGAYVGLTIPVLGC